jgi:glycosyltransferase involved in cell wall biosynthesis
MKKMLFITAYPPSKLGGGENYTRQLLLKLSSFCFIDLIYFRTKKDITYQEPNNNIKVLYYFTLNNLKKTINSLLYPILFPLFTVRFNLYYVYLIRQAIKLKDYDFVYLDFSQTLLYAKFIKHNNIILMSHDVNTQRYGRIANKMITYFCQLSENYVLKNRKTTIFVSNEKDELLLNKMFDIKSYYTKSFISQEIINLNLVNIQDYFVFFASWDRKDNYYGLAWFLENIIGKLRDDVQFKIIGGGLSIDNIDYEKYKNIEYLGFVDNPYPIISNAKALIAPIFSGAGVKIKVIEALACGTPVIGTNIAFEGIDKMFSPFMIKAQKDIDFVNRINEVNFSIKERQDFKRKVISYYEDSKIIDFIKTNNI